MTYQWVWLILKANLEKEDSKAESSVWNGLFVWTVGLQSPSHLCVDYTPFTLLCLLFIYRSAWKKNTQLHSMRRHISGRLSKHKYVYVRLKRAQAVVRMVDLSTNGWTKPMRNTQQHSSYASFVIFSSYSVVWTWVWNLTRWGSFGLLMLHRFKAIQCVKCWSVKLPAEDSSRRSRNTPQKQGDVEKETISKSLSILADSSALKSRFSQEWLAQFEADVCPSTLCRC